MRAEFSVKGENNAELQMWVHGFGGQVMHVLPKAAEEEYYPKLLPANYNYIHECDDDGQKSVTIGIGVFG